MNNKQIKGGLLKPFEICEFSEGCKQECLGKDSNRKSKFSCGLRRGLLIADGFEVRYGCIIDDIRN